MRPRNRRRQQKAEKARWRIPLPAVNWQRAARIVVSLAVIAALGASLRWFVDQPIEQVSILGRFQRVSPAEVEKAVKARVNGQGLFAVDLDRVQLAVDGIPWVDSASVRRAWPRGLEVTVVEQVAAARWGESGLLNTRGQLFVTAARHVPTELPRLSGPDGTEHLVAQRYLATQGRLVEAGMRMTAMRLDERGAWEIDLDNGVTVRLGRRQVDERFETFMKTALKVVGQRAMDISYIDMRYTNGFAIGWRSGPSRHNDEDEERDA